MRGNGTEWIDVDLPTPSYHEHLTKGYLIAYALDGYFGTKANQNYLNDIIARFLVTFKNQKPYRILEKPSITPAGKYLAKAYKLKELHVLKSISTQKHAQTRADKFDDSVFWAIKFHCEDLISTQMIVTYEQLFYFATNNFEHKEVSTLRAKCRSIWNWYESRDWTIPTRKGLGMSRTENIKKVTAKKMQDNLTKVKKVIVGLEFMKEKINIANVSRDAKVSRNTAKKYMIELGYIDIP